MQNIKFGRTVSAVLKLDELTSHFAKIDVGLTSKAPEREIATTLLLDCSGSMMGYIHQVAADAQKYVAELGDDEWVSVVIYSGHGQARLIAGPTQTNKKGRDLVCNAIKKEVRVIGCTVFSEPLELTLEKIIRTHDTLSHGVSLFTDGCPVPTQWSDAKEREKAFDVARAIGKAGAVLSTVAYGPYYDAKFLDGLLQASGNAGISRHISDMDAFGPAVQSIRDTFRKLAPIDIDLHVKADGKSSVKRAMRTTPEVLALGEGGTIRAHGLYEGQMSVYLECSSAPSKLTIEGTVNGKPFAETIACLPATDDDKASYLRLLAAQACLKGNTLEAAELLRRTNDIGLADRVEQAYTPIERLELQDNLRRAFVGARFIGAGLKPSGPNRSVLNVLRVLIEDTRNVVYIPKGGYKRGGVLRADPRVVESPHGRTTSVVGYSSHDERANFSIKTVKDVKVLPESGSGPAMDMKVYRDYNVIRDGNLVLSQLEAVLTEESFDKLQEAGVIDDGATFSATKAVTLDLTSLPLIAKGWASPLMVSKLSDLLREEADLEVQLTALNARMKATAASGKERASGGEMYRETAKPVEGVEMEYYDAACVHYRLKGYKPAAVSKSIDTMTFEAADLEAKKVNQRLREVRFIVRSIRFAVEFARPNAIAWGSAAPLPRSKNKQVQTAQQGAFTLERVTWTEKVICS